MAKAWVFNGPQEKLELQQFEFSALNKDELLVKNKYCTICKSDLHTFSGAKPGPQPSVLGHEIVGEIAKLPQHPMYDYWGNLLSVGDLITWTLMAFCGNCRNCKRGIPQKCSSLKKYGHEKINSHFKLTGGFASHMHLYPGTVTYKLPAGIDGKLLAGLNCSWATVASAIRSYGDVSGKNILIFGAGMLGVVALVMCKEYGAKNITVVEKNNFRLGLIRYFGTDFIIPASLNNDFVNGRLQQYFGGDDVDVIFEMTGATQAINLAFNIAGVGAEIILVGSVFPTNNISVNPEQIVRKLLKIKGVHNYTPDDLATAILFITEVHSKYPFNLLFEEKVYTLETLDKAVENAKTSVLHRVAIAMC